MLLCGIEINVFKKVNIWKSCWLGTTCALNGLIGHLPANQNHVFRQTMVFYT